MGRMETVESARSNKRGGAHRPILLEDFISFSPVLDFLECYKPKKKPPGFQTRLIVLFDVFCLIITVC